MNLKELHNIYFEKLIVLIDYCKKKDLKILPVGGTLLGIVKYKDFIPWDDDVDLALPRLDYEKLYEDRHELEKIGIILKRYKNDRKFPFPYMKVFFKDVGETNILDDQFNVNDDILPFFDIYPIDYLGQSPENALQKIRRVNRWKKVYDIRITQIKKFTNIAKKVVGLLIHLIPIKTIIKAFDKSMKRKTEENFVTRWRGPSYENFFYESEHFLNVASLQFRDLFIDCPKGYHAILESVYGDYINITPVVDNARHSLESLPGGAVRNYLKK